MTRLFRSALVRYVRAQPRTKDWEGAERRVYMMLVNAYAVDGTIKATLNLAVYLASRGYDIVIVSARRDRARPFFGELPPRVNLVSLDELHEELLPDGFHPLRRWMRERRS